MKSLIIIISLLLFVSADGQFVFNTDDSQRGLISKKDWIKFNSKINYKNEEIGYKSLAWSDFRGPVIKQNVTAETVSQIQMNSRCENGKCSFVVRCVFLPEESFTTTADEVVLRHENLHFSLTYVFSKKIEKALISYQGCPESKKAKVMHIYESWCDSLEEVQKIYDKETQNSMNKIMQDFWEKRTSSELATYGIF